MKKISSVFLGILLSTQLSAQEVSNPGTKCDYICNMGFDISTPQIGTVSLLNNTQLPCWNTTATDGLMEIWHNGYNGVPSYSGDQFLEINATQSNTVYQDFVVSPGTVLSISFAHRGRAGEDVMQVECGPVGGPYTDLGHFVDNETAWGYYTVPYTVPTGSGNNYTVRFTSLSWAGGNDAIGNFLDAVSVCSDPKQSEGCSVCDDTQVFLNFLHITNTAGNGKANLSINSGSRAISKIRVTLLNFKVAPANPDCKDYCNLKDEDFGHIVGIPDGIPGFIAEFAPYNPTVNPQYTNQLTFSTGSPTTVDDYITLDLKFPSFNPKAKCALAVEACFRIELISDDCVVCDRIVCNMGVDGAANTKNMDATNGISTERDRAVKVYPNPSNGTFTISTEELGAGCTFQLLDLEGREIQSGTIENKSLEISENTLANGTYTLAVFKGNQVFFEKITILK